MTPDSGDELVRVVADLMGWPMTTGTGMGVGGDPESYAAGLRESVDTVLAELRPLIEAEAGNRIADAIEKHRDAVWTNFDPVLTSQARAAKYAYSEAARIARGET